MTSSLEAGLIGQAWAALVEGDPSSPQLEAVEVTGADGRLVSRFAVEETAVACVVTAMMAALALHRQRNGSPGRGSLDRGHVAAAVRSERYFRRRGQGAGMGFAPLSRFWRTADGWVRTHANYSWHRAALLSTLGTSDDVESVAGAMADRRAEDVEETVFAGGGIAAAVRPFDVWRVHAQGLALASEPLIAHRRADGAAPRRRPPARLPAAGMRVLDLTRVIAGPVCTRYLAALGADVLRLDPPGHLDMRRGEVADTLAGKRSALLELRSADGAATLQRLLDGADVVVCGYRPGALDAFGLDEQAVAARHPGVVVVYLDAWGHSGPWAGRRGFDSVVQAPTGVAAGEATTGAEPGALPCQLLDHGTGYLAAAAVLDGLRRQADQGGTHVRRLSLARTAWWLTAAAHGEGVRHGAEQAGEAERSRWVAELDSTLGPVTAVLPPGHVNHEPLRWAFPFTGYGNDPPSWPSG